ncbi:MAG TPA: peptide MFS transporter [Caulobacteraceae bacterium]|nr:peptide MFS transporter [Caulobacteraceae bacterium]
MSAEAAAPAPVRGGDWFGQPRGLTILFLTEMWEQFSFFGMRALLVYYMTKQLMIAQGQASLIYGLYAAGVYFTPIVGGAIADRWLGRKRAVVLGGAIMACGHFMMAFEGLFYPALVTIAVGNGFFLPSLPSQIDDLYAPDDPRRRSAYNVYYVGINIGAFLAPLVAGTVGEVFGWHWGFTVAGVGMVTGLVIYLAGGRYLPPEPARGPQARAAASRASGPEVRRLFLLLIAIAAVIVVFRGAYEQNGNTIALWTDEGVDRHVFGSFYVPRTWFQSLNPLVVFLFTPVLVSRWTRLSKTGREPASIIKMVIGAIIMGVSFAALGAVAWYCGAHGLKASWLWLVAFFVAMTTGELYILPVGLGLFGRLAPEGLSATTIATWFFAGFLGNLLAGWIGSFWDRMDHGLFFIVTGAVAGLAAALLFALAAPARRAERAV